MCGILFSIGLEQELCLEALKDLKHRGPDESSYLFQSDNQLFFGFQRLAIQDLSIKASQPLWSKNKMYMVLYNGEIYNTKELKNRYLKQIDSNTNSDTEVIANLLEIFGVRKVLNMIEGMFALCIYELKSEKIFIARDYFGIKRMYWSKSKNEVMVASEIKPILKRLGKYTFNEKIVSDWVGSGLIDHSSETFYNEIQVVESGHYLEIDKFKNVRSFEWRENLPQKDYATRDEFLEDTLITLKSTISNATVGDVPMGILLSGGSDSSLLYLMMQEIGFETKPFTINWADELYSELKWVKSITNPKNLKSIELSSMEIFSRIESSLLHYAQPFGSPFIICLEELFKNAYSSGVKVLFDGNGLDELFYGYQKYLLPKLDANQLRSQDGTIGERESILGTKLRSFLIDSQIKKRSEDRLSTKELRNYDLFYGKLPRALRYTDQTSMRFSCELRVPFLNKSLLQVANSAKMEWLIDEHHGKKPVRRVLENYTSYNLGHLKKRPLQSPMREWFLKDWKENTLQAIVNSPLVDMNWINVKKFESEYNKYIKNFNSNLSNANFIWQWLMLANWTNLYA